jgi:hypothetical protein
MRWAYLIKSSTPKKSVIPSHKFNITFSDFKLYANGIYFVYCYRRQGGYGSALESIHSTMLRACPERSRMGAGSERLGDAIRHWARFGSPRPLIYAVGSNAINPSRKAAVFANFFGVNPNNTTRLALI